MLTAPRKRKTSVIISGKRVNLQLVKNSSRKLPTWDVYQDERYLGKIYHSNFITSKRIKSPPVWKITGEKLVQFNSENQALTHLVRKGM